MKKILFIALLPVFISCMQSLEESSTTQNYVVKGTINGDFDEYIKIKYRSKTDSVKVLNNTFEFKGEVLSPTAFQFQFDSINYSDTYYLENDTLVFDIIVDQVELKEEKFINYEVNQLNGGKTKKLKAELKTLLNNTPRSKLNRTVILNKMDSLIKAYPNHDYLGKILSELSIRQDLLYDEVRSLSYKLDTEKLNDQDLILLENYQQKRREFLIGSKIPSYELLNIPSDTVNLETYFSKYNLLAFWSSWCETCISEQEELLKLFQKYNFKGFDIIGISLDANHEDWISFLTVNSTPWPSLRVENGFTGEMPTKMGIVDLPQYYLVDKNGRIIEINLSIDELDTILSVLLN